jgi:hypothetical protein
MEQNYKNHSRYVPLYHLVCSIILLALLIAAAVDLLEKLSDGENYMESIFRFLVVVVLLIFYWLIRAFPLKAQDRVILLEEKLRHQQLTGKPLNSKLHPSQIIALRFASDAEFPALAERAAAENMSSKSIKQSIKNWKADNHRV